MIVFGIILIVLIIISFWYSLNDVDKKYEVVTWPSIQNYINIEGFEDNSYLINDEKGITKFGSSAYFVNSEWLKKADKQIYGS